MSAPLAVGRRCLAAITIVAMIATQSLAGPTKVQVLPVDGNADAPTRAKLTASIQKLARVIEGQVKPGQTSFADAATAAGCDPKATACADSVRQLLGVDELVYGTATVDNGQVTVVIKRKKPTGPPTEITATFAVGDAPEKIEPTVLPLFSGTPVTPPPTCEGGAAPVNGVCPAKPSPPCPEGQARGADGACAAATPAPACPGDAPRDAQGNCPSATTTTPPANPADTERALAIGGMIAGGLAFAIGLGLWSSTSDLQGQIDKHPADTSADILDLRKLEDKAASRALFGNVMVLGGIALGAVGGWLYWKDRKRRLTIVPAPVEGGATVTLTWRTR